MLRLIIYVHMSIYPDRSLVRVAPSEAVFSPNSLGYSQNSSGT